MLWDNYPDNWRSMDGPEPQVTETDNNITAQLLGAKGEVLSVIYERPKVSMGYVNNKSRSKIVRYY